MNADNMNVDNNQSHLDKDRDKYNFDLIDITTMTVIAPTNGFINTEHLTPWLRLSRVNAEDWIDGKVKNGKIVHPGFEGSIRSVGYREMFFGARKKGVFKNSIGIDVSVTDKMINCKLSSKIHMTGVKDISQAEEAVFFVHQNIYESQRLINKCQIDLHRTIRTFEWVKQNTRGDVYEYTSESYESSSKVIKMNNKSNITLIIVNDTKERFLNTIPSEYTNRVYPEMWKDRCSRIISLPPTASLVQQFAAGYIEPPTCSVGGTYIDSAGNVHNKEDAKIFKNINNLSSDKIYPDDICPELADLLIEKIYDYIYHDDYVNLLDIMFKTVDFIGYDNDIQSPYNMLIRILDSDIDSINIPELNNLRDFKQFNRFNYINHCVSIDKALFSLSYKKEYNIPMASKYVHILQQIQMMGTLYTVGATEETSKIPPTTPKLPSIPPFQIGVISKDNTNTNNVTNNIYSKSEKYNKDIIETSKNSINEFSNLNINTDILDDEYTFNNNSNSNHSLDTNYMFNAHNYLLMISQLKPLTFKRAMITYNYNLEFAVRRDKLYEYICSYPEFRASYDNTNPRGVHLYIKVDIPDILNSEVTNKNNPNHSFIVNKKGSVTQSGPHEDLNRQAYIHFKYIIKKLMPNITRKNGDALIKHETLTEIESRRCREIYRKNRRKLRYTYIKLDKPEWYVNTLSEIGDPENQYNEDYKKYDRMSDETASTDTYYSDKSSTNIDKNSINTDKSSTNIDKNSINTDKSSTNTDKSSICTLDIMSNAKNNRHLFRNSHEGVIRSNNISTKVKLQLLTPDSNRTPSNPIFSNTSYI